MLSYECSSQQRTIKKKKKVSTGPKNPRGSQEKVNIQKNNNKKHDKYQTWQFCRRMRLRQNSLKASCRSLMLRCLLRSLLDKGNTVLRRLRSPGALLSRWASRDVCSSFCKVANRRCASASFSVKIKKEKEILIIQFY